jgi:hypothetical protein
MSSAVYRYAAPRRPTCHRLRVIPEARQPRFRRTTQEIEVNADCCHPRRRALLTLLALSAGASSLLIGRDAEAQLAGLSESDASAGLKGALEAGATTAVGLLGRTDGFWGNDALRIPLPDWLRRAERPLKLAGRGKDIDALKLGVNRAAEQAVPQAQTLLVDAVKTMSVTDAKAILTGGDDSVTRFFADRTRAPLTERFLPIVAQTTEKIGLAQQYNGLVDQAGRLGLVGGGVARIEKHVTDKALDGLYFMIGEEERKIRRDPIGASSAIVRKVFGALR